MDVILLVFDLLVGNLFSSRHASVSWHWSNDDIAGGDTVSDDIVSDDITDGDIVSDDITGGDIVSHDITDGDIVSDHITGGDTLNDDVTGDDTVSHDITGGDVAMMTFQAWHDDIVNAMVLQSMTRCKRWHYKSWQCSDNNDEDDDDDMDIIPSIPP